MPPKPQRSRRGRTPSGRGRERGRGIVRGKVRCRYSPTLHSRSPLLSLPWLHWVYCPRRARPVSWSLKVLGADTKPRSHRPDRRREGDSARTPPHVRSRPARRTRKWAPHVLCGKVPDAGQGGGLRFCVPASSRHLARPRAGEVTYGARKAAVGGPGE